MKKVNVDIEIDQSKSRNHKTGIHHKGELMVKVINMSPKNQKDYCSKHPKSKICPLLIHSAPKSPQPSQPSNVPDIENNKSSQDSKTYSSLKANHKDLIERIENETNPYNNTWDYGKILKLENIKFDINNQVLDDNFEKINSFKISSVGLTPLDYRHKELNHKFQIEHKGIVLGDINYGIKNNILEIGSLDVKTPFKGKGISNVMMTHILQKHPEIREIATRLSGDNMFSINSFCEEQGYKDFKSAPEKVRQEAIMNSPAYKIRKKHGFTSISSIKYHNKTFQANEGVTFLSSF